LRHAITTVAPLDASARAMAKPMPEFAPVTTATLPSIDGVTSPSHKGFRKAWPTEV
jgi:hypothetical protein